MRGTYIQLAAAVENGDYSQIGEIAESIRESELITAIASRFHYLRERATELWDAMVPWAKVILGLVVGLAGYFLAAELGLVLAAILMIGGFIFASINALSVMLRRGIEGVQ